METIGFQRKLAAILSADVAGYSRLMQDDEAATVKTLEAYKQIFSDLIRQHRGRVVDSPGDNLLAEFGSVVDAVQCAVAVQKEFQARNVELPEHRRMQFRIGVNLGDVIEEGARIYGDGVNIAARLESIADPGGICISKTAFDQIETKLPFNYKFIGEQAVKNIARPVGAYCVLLEPKVSRERRAGSEPKAKRLRVVGLAVTLVVVVGVVLWQNLVRSTPQQPAAPIEKVDPKRMAQPLPDKPSIAVLPFAYTSGDPQHEYLSDGITDAVISALAHCSQLFIIGRNSTYAYKGKPVRYQQVSEEMGVRHVLEGSVQYSGERIRINAQLIDALTGYHVFSERYDRPLKDLFATQDEISMKILTATRVTLTQGEEARVFAKGTGNLEAYLKLMQAREHHEVFTKESQALAPATGRRSDSFRP